MTVRNWRSKQTERVDFIAPDGATYELTGFRSQHLIQMEGWGALENNIATTQGPFQHGVSPVAVRAGPRTITIRHLSSNCNRDDYWSKRGDLVDILRLNRTDLNNPSPGALRWYLSNGNIRQVDVMVIKGPVYKERDDAFMFDEQITFLAHNPIIYDPTSIIDNVLLWACTPANQLQFPAAVGGVAGLLFGGSICNVTQNHSITFTGTWEEYPTIVVTGPANDISIINNDTGKKLALDYNIAAGEVVTFDLSYGVKNVTNNFGTDLINFITDDSDLAVFTIQPNPIVTDGINTFSISIDNGTGATIVSFQYFTRYAGI